MTPIRCEPASTDPPAREPPCPHTTAFERPARDPMVPYSDNLKPTPKKGENAQARERQVASRVFGGACHAAPPPARGSTEAGDGLRLATRLSGNHDSSCRAAAGAEVDHPGAAASARSASGGLGHRRAGSGRRHLVRPGRFRPELSLQLAHPLRLKRWHQISRREEIAIPLHHWMLGRQHRAAADQLVFRRPNVGQRHYLVIAAEASHVISAGSQIFRPRSSSLTTQA